MPKELIITAQLTDQINKTETKENLFSAEKLKEKVEPSIILIEQVSS